MRDHTRWSSGRVLALCVGGRGFNFQLGHTIDLKWYLGLPILTFDIKRLDQGIGSVYPLLTVKCDRVGCSI